MTKFSLQYNRSDLDSYTINYKNGLSNDINVTTITAVSIGPLYTGCDNKKVGNIQFNYMIVQNNDNQTSSSTENIFFEFADCNNSSIYAVNKFESYDTKGSYDIGKTYTFRIVSGTGQYLKSKGWIAITAEKDIRHITVKLE